VALSRLSRPIDRRQDPPAWLALLVIGLLVASRFPALARSPGEIDEAVFSGAVTHYDLFELSPQAPGFPLWILIGRALLPLCVTPFNALATASTFLSALALPALYVWGRRLVGGWAALGAATFGAALPVVWVNGGRAFADTPGTAFCLAAAALLSLTEERRVFNLTRWREQNLARRARLWLSLGLSASRFGVGPTSPWASGSLAVMAGRLFSPSRAAGHSRLLLGALSPGRWPGSSGSRSGRGLSGLKASVTAGRFKTPVGRGASAAFSAPSPSTSSLSSPGARLLAVFAAGAAALLKQRSRRVSTSLVLGPLPVALVSHNRSMSRYRS
jgi:hypothetical protein